MMNICKQIMYINLVKGMYLANENDLNVTFLI